MANGRTLSRWSAPHDATHPNPQVPKPDEGALIVKPIIPKTKSEIVYYSTYKDPQGIDWSEWPRRTRAYYQDHIDKQMKPYFCVLTEQPSYAAYSRQVDPQFNPIVEQISTYKSHTIANFHFQLHHNFAMFSGHDCLFSTKNENYIERLNLKTGQKIQYPGFRNVMCLNVSKKHKLLVVGYTDSQYAIISLDSGKVIKTEKLI
jgi:hypothetical protein